MHLWNAPTNNQNFTCQAKGRLKVAGPENQFSAPFRLEFSYRKKDASFLVLSLLSPFFTPKAKLEISNSKGTLQDESGRRDLSQEPLFNRWFNKNWAREIAFTLGHPIAGSNVQIFSDDQGEPRLMTHLNRRISCETRRDDDAKTIRLCEIVESRLAITLNFAFYQCDSSI